MRKNAKEQIENYIQVVEEAHEEVRKALSSTNYDVALELLEECQTGAIRLGTMIEESEGEGFVTVTILENYCELIYQIHEELLQSGCPNSNSIDPEEVYRNLEQLLIQVKDSVRKDIKVHREVVFLPYKASMWDSLESVWRAADEDSDCDAYVIPIPYYDRNADGTFGEMHYEGELYPTDVPIVDYNSYDFQTRRPDMIFIHNPYDEHNTVTSVHPFFYSKNLKKYTDNLIYIPYFVLDEVNTTSWAAIQGMEHFVTVSGVIHADTVIVQSESMRQIYIEVMSRVAGENTRPIWEKKILGLGSPKFDKLHSTRREDLDIPEEWQRIVQKQDGSLKKVILYNTSVSALLKHEDKMLAKMQRAFKTFKEYQEEVALLWRPHPLITATIESMRPQLREDYEKLVAQYKRENWGIYDDTADLDRAITLCDAYYGDESSLVQLCKGAGKSIMIQSVDV